MRKIPEELENPVDNICIDIGEFLSELFHRLGFTANGLTTVSLILGMLSIKFYMEKDYIRSAVYFFISYMFDCFDGFYARKYNMVSDFGDAFDHFRDIVINSVIFWLIFKKYWKLNTWHRYLPFVTGIFFIIMEIHIGCQEIYFNSTGPGSKFLSMLKQTCPKQDKQGAYDTMKITRYFGTGSFAAYVTFLILYSSTVDSMLK